jgi:FAD/FMN-containing dehydrogenases
MTNASSHEEMKRRAFLQLCAAGSLTGWLAACGSASTTIGATGSATARPVSTPQAPQATKPPVATAADWSALAQRLHGTLVRPDSAQYATALQLYDPRFDTIHPAGIAYCADVADVQSCLDFAHRFAVPLTPRSGGHSYAGYSTTTGLVVDVTRMNTTTVNVAAQSVTIGAGARLVDVYATLTDQGVIIPAGSCPTVGIAGLTLGGGVGVLGRKYGLTCDALLSADVVLADGRVVTCDSSHATDLFWALRGGGGGNFGIVTGFTFRTYTVSALSLFTLRWPWSSAAQVVDAWQHWAPSAPDEIWSNCVLLTTTDQSAGPIVQVNGVYVGSSTALSPLLSQLTGNIDASPSSNYVTDASVLDTMLYEAGCSGKSIAACHLPTQNPQGELTRTIEDAKSDYFARMLSQHGIGALVSAIGTRQADATPGTVGIGLDPYGGAISRVQPTATAFAHRDVLFSAQYNINYDVGSSSSVVAANHQWLVDIKRAMGTYATGASYQNYIDTGLTDWQHAYYGNNITRLRQVKTTYDPANFFHFGQSIPTLS